VSRRHSCLCSLPQPPARGRAGQTSSAVAGSRHGQPELAVAEQASLLIEHRSVMGATVGVDPADDHPGPLGHAGVAFPLDDRPGQDGHAPVGRADTLVTGLSVQARIRSPAGPVVRTTWPCRTGRRIPVMTRSQVRSGSDQPGQTSP